ncbi:MAG TPA: MBL fold metallo-hydrolase [Egibacteraceae bacterium]|nr:MBL fold metallo-hydrolase [Egibacteraceae bacterium]
MSEESGYSGHVEPRGPAINRTVDVDGVSVQVRKFSVGWMDNNVYLLADPATGEGLLIDAADDAERILEEVGDTRLRGIVTTHGHRDHWRALDAVAEATDAPVWLHGDDADMVPWTADRAAEHGTRIGFGQAEVRLLHTPGHTPGSVCLLLGDTHLFSGDTLFPGGPGRTTNQEEFQTIMRSIEERLFTLPDETWVYPGHGDDTTLGAERPHLPAWRARGW